MRKVAISSFFLSVATSTVSAQTAPPSPAPTAAPTLQVLYDDCDPSVYYSDLPNSTSSWTRDQVAELITKTHRTVVPVVADSRNIIDALIDLDPGNINGETVWLVYRDRSFPAEPSNTLESWRREDLWPMGPRNPAASNFNFTNTPMQTDVHVKKPADWSVEAVRGELFYGECGTVDSEANCITPATDETAPDTSTDRKIWLPPEDARGAIARALFYNQLRYEAEYDVQLSDCPPFALTDYGYKSALLQWHNDYPVTDAELNRNDRACSVWQGNRNPFVDYPDLVEQFFGSPDDINSDTMQYSACTAPTMAPTATLNECSRLSPGDVSIFLFNSDDDQIAMYVVNGLDEGVGSIFVTDRAWNGESFEEDGEGTIEYMIPSGGLARGALIGYKFDNIQDGGSWEQVPGEGIFDLTVTGDNLLVYCLNADDKPIFLNAISYAGDFAKAGLDSYNTTETALPSDLETVGSVAVEGYPNWRFTQITAVRLDEFLANYVNASNWEGSDNVFEISSTSRCGMNVFFTAALATLMWTMWW